MLCFLIASWKHFHLKMFFSCSGSRKQRRLLMHFNYPSRWDALSAIKTGWTSVLYIDTKSSFHGLTFTVIDVLHMLCWIYSFAWCEKSVACPIFSSFLIGIFLRNYEWVRLPLSLKWLEKYISVFAKSYRVVDKRAILENSSLIGTMTSFICWYEEICKAVAIDGLFDQCAVQHSYNFCISTPILKLEMTISVVYNCEHDETVAI